MTSLPTLPPADDTVEAGSTCFSLPIETKPDPQRLDFLRRLFETGRPKLDGRASAGLSRLLPAMICGEESAVLVFHDLRLDWESFCALRGDLARIECEERTHHAMLGWLRGHLPLPDDLHATRTRAKRLFTQMDCRDLRRHLGRIVELDSAVCRLMHAAQRSPALRSHNAICRTFEQIRLDEARHVAMSRKLRTALGWSADPDPDDRDFVQSCIKHLLQPLGGALEDVGIDPDKLWKSFKARVA